MLIAYSSGPSKSGSSSNPLAFHRACISERNSPSVEATSRDSRHTWLKDGGLALILDVIDTEHEVPIARACRISNSKTRPSGIQKLQILRCDSFGKFGKLVNSVAIVIAACGNWSGNPRIP